MIEITQLVKKYGDHYAVKNLNFHVEKGCIYGFLGPNGAGKSTTMNIITGYLAPTSGQVKIDGHDIMAEPEAAKRLIGYLPEIPPLYQDMTVEEYLLFVAQLKKTPAKKQAVSAAMELAKAADVRKRLIANLSKGYRQRVGLAQAVLGDPPIIILDEPTVGLDPKQMIEMRELIRGLREKHTVILSSHLLTEVNAVCDQVLILAKGELVASDTPEGLRARMQGGSSLTLTVKGTMAALRAALSGIEELYSVEYIKEEEGCATAALMEKTGGDVRERLFYILAEHRLPIYALGQDTGSLEDIFLKLTEDSAPAAGSAQPPEDQKKEEDKEEVGGNESDI